MSLIRVFRAAVNAAIHECYVILAEQLVEGVTHDAHARYEVVQGIVSNPSNCEDCKTLRRAPFQGHGLTCKYHREHGYSDND